MYPYITPRRCISRTWRSSVGWVDFGPVTLSPWQPAYSILGCPLLSGWFVLRSCFINFFNCYLTFDTVSTSFCSLELFPVSCAPFAWPVRNKFVLQEIISDNAIGFRQGCGIIKYVYCATVCHFFRHRYRKHAVPAAVLFHVSDAYVLPGKPWVIRIYSSDVLHPKK